MGYVLPCIAADEEELLPIQSKIMAAALQKWVYQARHPWRFVMGQSTWEDWDSTTFGQKWE
jgi:hypothetical protein